MVLQLFSMVKTAGRAAGADGLLEIGMAWGRLEKSAGGFRIESSQRVGVPAVPNEATVASFYSRLTFLYIFTLPCRVHSRVINWERTACIRYRSANNEYLIQMF